MRDDETNAMTFQELRELNIDYTALRDLHCKLYMNEKYAIVSSMNLLLSSEINSLELAYKTETEEEYQELVEFSKRYLGLDVTAQKHPGTYGRDWRASIEASLNEKLGRQVSMEFDGGCLNVNPGKNNYACFIWNDRQNYLRISGILSGKEFEYLKITPQKILTVRGLDVALQEGRGQHYDMIWGTGMAALQSASLVDLNNGEQRRIADMIIEFVSEVDDYKDWAYHNRELVKSTIAAASN